MNRKEKEIPNSEIIKALDITLQIKQKLAILQDELQKRQNSLSNAPHGALRCRKDNCGYRYYQRLSSDDLCGQYLRKDKIKLAQSLAQKEYDKKLIAVITKEIKSITSFLNSYEHTNINAIYESMHEGKKKLVKPFLLDDKEYAKRWLAVEYSPGFFPANYDEYYTLKGLRVHSKSEIIIANCLDSYGIPYRYEYPVLIDGTEKRPDFLCLNVRTRKEYLWEHFGMMGTHGYSTDNIIKINKYLSHGFFPGENVIFTFESESNSIDTKVIKLLIERYLV